MGALRSQIKSDSLLVYHRLTSPHRIRNRKLLSTGYGNGDLPPGTFDGGGG